MTERPGQGYETGPVASGESPGGDRWVESWRYPNNERDLAQRLGSDDHSDGNSKSQEGRTTPLGSARVNKATKKENRKRELAEREKQRRMDLANAFDELQEFLAKIEPRGDLDGMGGNPRKRPPSPEPETLGMNRLDLIGRTIDTLRRLYEENMHFKQGGGPVLGKVAAKDQEVLVMVPTHSTTVNGAPRRPGLAYLQQQIQQPPGVPQARHPPQHQSLQTPLQQPQHPPAPGQGQPLPGQLPQLPHPQSHPQQPILTLPPGAQGMSHHPPPLSLAQSVDYHASPLPYYSAVAQYAYPGHQPWADAPTMPHSPLPPRDNAALYYPPQHQQTPPPHQPQLHYAHQYAHYRDRPHSFIEGAPKPLAANGAPAQRWRLPVRPVEEDPASRVVPRPREDPETWGSRPPSRQY